MDEEKKPITVSNVAAAMMVAHVALLNELRLAGVIDPARLAADMRRTSIKVDPSTSRVLELFARVGLGVPAPAKDHDE